MIHNIYKNLLFFINVFNLFNLAVLGDIYLHNPRGSNNRCDERTNDRLNANRLFDSQNNAAGGYAVPCGDINLDCYNMKFYTESYLDIRFTSQHACGIENQCEIIIQYGCNMRNGNPTNNIGNTCTQTMPDNIVNINNTIYGYHESYNSYQECKNRKRNLNLFTGDQRLRGLSSIYTRQNPNGQRYGFECPEERDYYPYWNNSEWLDIGVMTSNTSRCEFYKNHSMNKELICTDINNTMVNRLGATYEGRSENSFLWKLPNTTNSNCVLRLRYNISLHAELPFEANITYNPLFNTDPLIFVDGQYVRLALDTAQLPRTFEDRSYTFDIINLPSNMNIDKTSSVYNINVQGKRGNIAQVRNCFEYDFVPNNLTLYDNDYVHFQWVGSDFNPLGNDGEGRAGTDRTNLVDITIYDGYKHTQNNTFIPIDLINSFVYLNQLTENCYSYDELIKQNKIVNTQDIKNCALLNNATIYFNSRLFKIILGKNNTNKTYYYMSTRNNNFSNRNQKGAISVFASKSKSTISTMQNSTDSSASSSSSKLSAGYTALIVIILIGLIGTIIYVKRNYDSLRKKTINLQRSFQEAV
jgi:hypothetical protein